MRSVLRFGAPLVTALPLMNAVKCDGEPPSFVGVRCLSNKRHTSDTRTIEFDVSNLVGWSPNNTPVANVLVKHGETVRPYNPLEMSSAGTLTLLVKRYGDNAKMGSHLHELKPGDETLMKGPNTQKSLEGLGKEQYGFVAGGTGITPIIQAIRHILSHETTAKISLVTLNKSTGDILLRRELDELQASHPGRLEICHVVETIAGSNPAKTIIAVHGEMDAFSTTSIMRGKVSKELLEQQLPPPGAGYIMVCGRPGLTATVAGKKGKNFTQGALGGILKDMGYEQDAVWKI